MLIKLRKLCFRPLRINLGPLMLFSHYLTIIIAIRNRLVLREGSFNFLIHHRNIIVHMMTLCLDGSRAEGLVVVISGEGLRAVFGWEWTLWWYVGFGWGIVVFGMIGIRRVRWFFVVEGDLVVVFMEEDIFCGFRGLGSSVVCYGVGGNDWVLTFLLFFTTTFHHPQEHLITGFTNYYLIIQVHQKLVTISLRFSWGNNFTTFKFFITNHLVVMSYCLNYLFKPA